MNLQNLIKYFNMISHRKQVLKEKSNVSIHNG